MRVLFNIPNSIGYLRIVLLTYGLWIVRERPLLGCSALFMSSLLDAADGFCARRFGQETVFGAILDYSIDRVSIACFLIMLAVTYPQYWLIFCFLLGLDIGSHLFHLKVSHVHKKTSHKEVVDSEPWILRMYYSKRSVLFFSCAMQDLFLWLLYLHAFYPYPAIKWGLMAVFPGFLFKMVVNGIKILRAAAHLAAA